MAYILEKIGNTYNLPKKYFTCDAKSDLDGISLVDVPIGSEAYCILEEESYILDSNKQWHKKEIGEDITGQVQPDWNQNDNTAADYVKNRPFYTGDPVETVLVEESVVTFADAGGLYQGQFLTTFEATVGETYKVYWDGAAYESACVDYRDYIAIGNLSIAGAGSDTGEPFLMLVNNGRGIAFYTADTSVSHTFSISELSQEIVKIDEKYLPKASEDSYGLIKTSDFVSVYKLPIDVPHDQMVDAIAAFKTGNASIMWNGYKVIDAYYDSSADTISVTFAHEPLKTITFPNYNGFYLHGHGSLTYGELQGSKVRITNDNNVYAVLLVKGDQDNITLSFGVNRISIDGIYGMSTTEIILKSSTEGSKKKFKITVDDSGTISATEAT